MVKDRYTADFGIPAEDPETWLPPSQIVDSTHIVAGNAVISLTGLLKICRKKVLKKVARQNQGLASILGPE